MKKKRRIKPKLGPNFVLSHRNKVIDDKTKIRSKYACRKYKYKGTEKKDTC
jgi:hypothetical protein